MTERPILFSAPMVRALLDGRKTQTRHVVGHKNSLVNGGPPCMKDHPDIIAAWPNLDPNDAFVDGGPSPAGNAGPYLKVTGRDGSRHRVYPRIQPGDRLWVKETHRGSLAEGYVYRADSPEVQASQWKPSIFMPRWASRLTLTVTSVRPERLRDISEKDAVAEGVQRSMRPGLAPIAASSVFFELWDSINGKRPGCAWADNPWVWVYTFTSEVRS